MNCPWARKELSNICELPGLVSVQAVNCGGNQLFCSSPLQLMLVESEPVVSEDEVLVGWQEIVERDRYISEGRQ